MHRGVALGFSTNLGFQLGKIMNITAGQVIYITDGPDKGKWVVLGGAGFGYGTPGGSGAAAGSLEVYDYYGHIRNFSMKNFLGDSKSTSIMAGELIVAGATYSSSSIDGNGGILYGTSINAGLGGLGTFIGVTSVTKEMGRVKSR